MDLYNLITKDRKNYYKAANILIILLTYGFAIFNCSIGVDDENIIRSLDWRLFETGRFGLNIINSIFSIESFIPSFYMIICLILMTLSNHIITNMFKVVSNNEFDEIASTIFSLVVLSFPNFAYKFIFEQNLIQIGLVYLSGVLIAYFQYKFIYEHKHTLNIILIILLQCFILFNFESGIIISMMFTVYLMIIDQKNCIEKFIKKLSILIAILVSSLILFFIIRYIVLKIAGVIIDNYINGYILYDNENFVKIFIAIFKNFFTDLRLNIGHYLLYIFLATGLFILSFNKKRIRGIFLFAILIFLALSMIIVTGNFYISKRVTLYTPIFFAFCASSHYIITTNKKYINSLLKILLIIMIYNNSLTVNKIMYNDYLRSSLDKEKAYNIYNDINKVSININKKPTVFLGAAKSYKSPFNIEDGIDSIFVHDIITNNNLARETINFRIYPYFKMLGMPLIEADDILYTKCISESNYMPSYPQQGYIKETEKAIIVKLGNIKELTPIENLNLKNGKIRTGIDNFVFNNNVLTISGWAIKQYSPVNRVKKILLITDDVANKTYLYKCANVSRIDICNALGLSNNYEYCGYYGYINLSHLKKGTYTLQLVLDVNNELYYTDTIKHIEIS